MLPDIEIIVGTYTDFLLGYQPAEKQDDSGEQKVYLKPTFADKSHAGSLKCVAGQGQWIASGGSDDRIFIYDMRTRKQAHIVTAHAGTINALEFTPDLSHLLSGSANGLMLATRVGSWTTEGNWGKAHAGKAVTHIACHPSSGLALSLGADQVLNTWNLVKGRVAYRTNLKSKRTLGSSPECLSWSTDGQHFTLSGPLLVEIWSIEKASVVRSTKTPSKPICVAWLDEENVLVGLENGSIAWIALNAEQDAAPKIIVAHDTRVKAMAHLNETLVSISSAGEIKMWSTEIEEQQLNLIASVNIECRPTCLALLDLKQFGKKVAAVKPLQQTKQVSEEGDEEQDEEEEEDEDIALMKPRSFVSIEYDQDTKAKPKAKAKPESESSNSSSEDSDDGGSKQKKKAATPKRKANDSKNKNNPDNQQSSSESENESDSDDIDFGSSSEEEQRRPKKAKKAPNKRQANTNHKQRAKQTKKK
ncbi:p21-activated protein kinase-interacting protein 1-like [Drosophila sulfurigaster albostrigata]|uniref:p21-activated protein kinase-interacting protein 1-like n=1 Tax=Drosophila sulfurigaster albostrigata TaxID=89887 RepID=UPI002D218864|nr:p21-activated protein kinase-interacting protein 1-like [Drosophila sulfurigaster albostrigata]